MCLLITVASVDLLHRRVFVLWLFGQDCTLILTEGDSAKTLAVSGLGVVGRDRYGVFPLKGKLLNVREATAPQVLKNEEIQVRWARASAECRNVLQ